MAGQARQGLGDINDWCDEVGNPQHIVDLIAKVTTVAIETSKVIEDLGRVDAAGPKQSSGM